MSYQVQVTATSLKKIVDEVIRPNISTQERQTLLSQISKFDEMNNEFYQLFAEKDLESSTGLKLIEGKFEFSNGDVKIVVEKSQLASHVERAGKPPIQWNRYIFITETDNEEVFQILSGYFTAARNF